MEILLNKVRLMALKPSSALKPSFIAKTEDSSDIALIDETI